MSAISGHCRHYGHTLPNAEGLGNPTCAAGVDNAEAHFWRRCMPKTSDLYAGSCSHRAEYTPEEVEAERLERVASMERLAKGMAAIPPPGPNKGRGTSGEVPCHVCGGTIRWARARSNGHLHAYCTTPNCFSVME